MNTSVGDLRYVESCSSAKCGEVTCSDTIQNFSVQHDENSEQKCDQEIENTSNFEGPSNLNMMATHIFSLQDECEKKDATIVSPSASDKSIQDEVHHAPTKLRLQTNVVPSMNIMQRCVVPSAAICDELLDSGAKTLCSNMPLKTQIEGKIDKDESTSTNANSMPFEKSKDGCCALTIGITMPLEETMNDGAYSYGAPQADEVIVHQYPCENESHIAELSESENKSELCDSTKCEVESINKRSVRDTPHKKRASLQNM